MVKPILSKTEISDSDPLFNKVPQSDAAATVNNTGAK
jgi:hypothetical protein